MQMQKLGYIVTKRKLHNIPEYIGIVNDLNGLVSGDKPVLIVGYSYAKSSIESFSILRKEVNDRLFWTFSKTENNEENSNDIRNFCEYCVRYAINRIHYHYINTLSVDIGQIKKMLSEILYGRGLCIYIGGEMAYVCNGNTVIGVSIQILSYCGIKRERLIKLFTKNKSNVIFFTPKAIGYKLLNALKNNKYAIAYFLSNLEDGERTETSFDRCICQKR